MHSPEPNLIQLAQDGDPISCLNLGKHYFYSTHIENNCQQAFEWIHRSAEQGNAEAQLWVADLYSLGQGTQQSNTDAYRYYTMAALQGSESALLRLRRLYRNEIMLHCASILNKEEENLIRPDDRSSKNMKKKLYESRTKYIRSDLVKNNVIVYFCERFKQCKFADMLDPEGSNETMTNLAFLYHHGYGVVKDVEQAIELYIKAANRGYVHAQYNLACLYQSEMTEDWHKNALHWYAAAAHGGHIEAQKYLDYLSQHGFKLDDLSSLDQPKWVSGECSEISDQSCFDIAASYKRSKNKRLYTKLNQDVSIINTVEISELAKRAISGDKYAIHQVGMNYYHATDGFPCNQYIGCLWIKLAAKLGVDDAQLFIGEMYKQEDNVLEQNYFKASLWFSRAKQNRAKFQLGLLHDNGLGVPRSYEKAEDLLTKSVDGSLSFQLGLFYFYNYQYANALSVFETCAKRGDMEAVDRIRFIYWHGYHVEKDMHKSFQLLEYAANRGHTKSQIALASLYMRGSFIKRDLLRTTQYYFLAAERGDPFAKYQMAMRYLSGVHVDRNYARAFQLIQESASQGCWRAKRILTPPDNIRHYHLENLHTLDMFLYVMEHNLGHVEYNIGCIYEERTYWHPGTILARLNTENAIHWYTVAANQNNADAQYRLGLLFEEGNAVEMDLPRASGYYKMAVVSRHCEATFRLACMYIQGRGVEQDFITAYHLFYDAFIMEHKSASDIISLACYKRNDKYVSYITAPRAPLKINDTINMEMLEVVGSENHAVQYELGNLFFYRDPERALPWLEKAGKGGIHNAYYLLGLIYERGKGKVKQDYSKALEVYRLCVNHAEASYRLGRMYHYGRGVQQDYTQAYYLYEKAVELSDTREFRILNRTSRYTADLKYRFILCPQRKFTDCVTMWEYLAQQRNTQAQYELGHAYQLGFDKPNFPECIKWYSMASEHVDAIRTLGYFYEIGLGGLEQDTQEALRLYEKASKLGDVGSIYRMGEVYYDGIGIEADKMKGILLYIEAAKDGCVNSRNRLFRCYSNGDIARQKNPKLLKEFEEIYRQSTYDAYEEYVF